MASERPASGKAPAIDVVLVPRSVTSTWVLGHVVLGILAGVASLLFIPPLVAPLFVLASAAYSTVILMRQDAANRLGDHSRLSIGQILERQVANGKRISIHDPGTGVLQKWYFDLRLSEEIDRCKRFGEHMALMRIGAPALSTSVDTWGSDAEWQLAQAVSHRMRAIDISTRTGSLELLACLPHTDTAGAQVAARRLLQDLDGWSLRFSIATYPVDAEDAEGLVRALLSREPADLTALEETQVVESGPRLDYRDILARLRAEGSVEVSLRPGEAAQRVKQGLRRAAKRDGVVISISGRDGRIVCRLRQQAGASVRAA